MVSALVRQGISPATVIDVGANVGQFAIAAAKLFPGCHVHSFEPLPECAERLSRYARKLGSITVYPIALGDVEGELSLNRNSYSLSSSFLPLARPHREAFPGAREVGSVRVQVSTLDRVYGRGLDGDGGPLPHPLLGQGEGTEEEGLSALRGPVMLKLDVQGFEARVLRGAEKTLARTDYMVLEASFKPMYEGEPLFADLVKMAEGFGFRFARPVGWLSEPRTGEVIQADLLFEKARRSGKQSSGADRGHPQSAAG